MIAETDKISKAEMLEKGRKVEVQTIVTHYLADIHTPAGIYLRLRDRFRDTILLESSDHHSAQNSYSYICVNAIAGIEIGRNAVVEYKLPLGKTESFLLNKKDSPSEVLWHFMQRFTTTNTSQEAAAAQGLYGYTSYDIVPLIEKLEMKTAPPGIPVARYRLYQYVIAINHYTDQLLLLENKIDGLTSEIEFVRSLIQSKDVPVYPFSATGKEGSNMQDEEYMELVKKGIAHCHRGDVFQVVFSRRFSQAFTGDDFNVYRALRHVNPSPYLFYFDYGDYKLMGSSPESQLVIRQNEATLNPIAGTFLRTGDDETDRIKANDLLNDPKENAEHIMLVDLARNDLSRVAESVNLKSFRQVRFYSHVIHLVSEVTGKLSGDFNPFLVLHQTFPAGTLTGAPKYRAMQLIEENEKTSRSFYGGSIGFVGFNGSCNHAILIRSFLSRNNELIFQAGAGIVAASKPEDELSEIKNKIAALKKAIELAANI